MSSNKNAKEKHYYKDLLAHRYIHSLPREHEEVINNMLREYKKCKVVFVEDIDLGIEVGATVFEPTERKQKFDRAKVKKETMKIIEEEWGRDEWKSMRYINGDKFICVGTAKEIAKKLNIKPRTVWWLTSPANKRRLESKGKGKRKGGNGLIAIKLDNKEE